MFKAKNILAIIFGAGIFSFGIFFLVIPFHFYEGGATGITLITYYLFKIPVSVMNLAINIPLFFLAWKLLGLRSLYLSLIGTFSVSIWMAIFELIPGSHHLQTAVFTALDGDILLACIGSGVILELGLGLSSTLEALQVEPILSRVSLTSTRRFPWDASC